MLSFDLFVKHRPNCPSCIYSLPSPPTLLASYSICVYIHVCVCVYAFPCILVSEILSYTPIITIERERRERGNEEKREREREREERIQKVALILILSVRSTFNGWIATAVYGGSFPLLPPFFFLFVFCWFFFSCISPKSLRFFEIL